VIAAGAASALRRDTSPALRGPRQITLLPATLGPRCGRSVRRGYVARAAAYCRRDHKFRNFEIDVRRRHDETSLLVAAPRAARSAPAASTHQTRASRLRCRGGYLPIIGPVAGAAAFTQAYAALARGARARAVTLSMACI
jgi:hypothetical protein